MRDPIGSCSRTGGIGIAPSQRDQHRIPKLKETAEAEKPLAQVRLNSFNSSSIYNKLEVPSRSATISFGETFPKAEIKDSELLKEKGSPNPQKLDKPSYLTQRPQSCGGHVETSGNHVLLKEHRQGLPDAKGSKVANLRALFAPISQRDPQASKPKRLESLSLQKQLRPHPEGVPDDESVDKQGPIGVQTHRSPSNQIGIPDAELASHPQDGKSVGCTPKSKSNPIQKQETHEPKSENNSKNKPSVMPEEKLSDQPIETGKDSQKYIERVVPLRTRSQIETRNAAQVASVSARVEKRTAEKDDEEMDEIVSRQAKRRFKIATYSAPITVDEEAKTSPVGNLSSQATLPHVWKSEHVYIDKSAFEFVSSVKTLSSDSPFVPLLDAQSEIPLSTQEIATVPIRFVTALEVFNTIIPGCNAMQRYETMQQAPWSPFKCLADTKARSNFENCKWSGRKCNKSIAGANRDLIKNLLVQLNGMNVYSDGEECITIFKALASQAICVYHKELALLLFKEKVRDLQNEQIPDQKAMDKIVIVASDSKFHVSWWLRVEARSALHYLADFRSFCKSSMAFETGNNSIRHEARQPLTTKTTRSAGRLTEHDETQDGHIYVYWNRASFGHLKIGFTGKEVDQRLREWEEQCHHIAEKQYQSPQKIKHAARVEKLIHAEFADQRVFEPVCHGCGKEHVEWFRGLDLGFVIQRIEAWSEWINRSPYECKRGAWHLKDDPEFSLPLPSAIETQPPQRLKKPSTPRAQLTSPRRSPRLLQALEESLDPQTQSRSSSVSTISVAEIESFFSRLKMNDTISARNLK